MLLTNDNLTETDAGPFRRWTPRLLPLALVAIAAVLGVSIWAGRLWADPASESHVVDMPLDNATAPARYTATGVLCERAQVLSNLDQAPVGQQFYLGRELTIDRAQICQGQLFLRFGEVQVSVAGGIRDAEQVEGTFADMSKERGGYVTKVQGNWAQVDPAGPDGSFNSVLLQVDGHFVQLLGTKDSHLDDLMTVANDLDFSKLLGIPAPPER